MFKNPQLVCYERPFVYNFNVTDGQIVKIYVERQSVVDILAKEREVNLKRIDDMQQKNNPLGKGRSSNWEEATRH